MSAVVVVPNHLPHLDFLHSWPELQTKEWGGTGVRIIVVQDNNERPTPPNTMDATVFNHQDIDADLGDRAWVIPRRTSAVRSYGYYKAWQTLWPDDGIILTLDNDCYPDRKGAYWVNQHAHNLKSGTTLDWVASTDQFGFTRGFPYRIRGTAKVALSHGLWSGVPDLDAATSLQNPNLRFIPATAAPNPLPRWSFFPMCGMNLAWRRELTPAMYFGLFGPEYGFDQYDDIWAGVLAKKVLDHLGWAAVTGAPSVEHRKQSDVYANLRKQAPGLEMNENFWLAVRRIQLTQTTVRDAYAELIDRLPDVIEGEPDGWTAKFKEAALIWAGLFQ